MSQWILDNEVEQVALTGELMSTVCRKLINAVGRQFKFETRKLKIIRRAITHFTADQLLLLIKEGSMSEWLKVTDALERGVINQFEPLDMYR